MHKLIFATNNKNKVEEIRSIIGSTFQLVTLVEAGILIDIPEPYDTLEENATQKSRTIHELTKENCFSEDTGLEVFALNGEPGVKSARYAGEGRQAADNIEKLLFVMGDIKDRRARFRTCMSLIYNDQEHLFEGICNGTITTQPAGNFGFGYDSVFIPDGADITFAEMSLEEKNVFSHRKKAVAKLALFLSAIGKD